MPAASGVQESDKNGLLVLVLLPCDPSKPIFSWWDIPPHAKKGLKGGLGICAKKVPGRRTKRRML